MQDLLIHSLCTEAQGGTLVYSGHFGKRLFERPQPDRAGIRYLLCDDDPEIIESNLERPGWNTYLIWGIIETGRVGHVLCSPPPRPKVITAYWPDTEPAEWANNYKRRVRS